MQLNLRQILKKIHRENCSVNDAILLFEKHKITKVGGITYAISDIQRLIKLSSPTIEKVDRCGINRNINDCGDASDY